MSQGLRPRLTPASPSIHQRSTQSFAGLSPALFRAACSRQQCSRDQHRRLHLIEGTSSTVAAGAVVSPPQVGYRDLFDAILTPLGGIDSQASWWLINITRDAVLPVLLALLLWRSLLSLTKRGQQFVESGLAAARQEAAAAALTGSTSSTDSNDSQHDSQHELSADLLRLTSVALTGPAAAALPIVMAINVLRNVAYLTDAWITKFNPVLPNEWLDDVVRLMCASLVPLDSVLTKVAIGGTSVFMCWVFLKWTDVLVQYAVRRQAAIDVREGNVPSKALELQALLTPLANLSSWAVVGMTGLLVVSSMGIDLRPLLAVGGASGIIIGLATQQLLGNAVSGLNIFLARPFLPAEHITLVGPQPVTGIVVRVDPLRTLIATDELNTVAVPNKLIADMVVINRSRVAGLASASPLSAYVRDVRCRVKLPYTALDKLEEFCGTLEQAALELFASRESARNALTIEVVKFTDAGVELAIKVALPRMAASLSLDARRPWQSRIQRTFVGMAKAAREFGGTLVTSA